MELGDIMKSKKQEQRSKNGENGRTSMEQQQTMPYTNWIGLTVKQSSMLDSCISLTL